MLSTIPNVDNLSTEKRGFTQNNRRKRRFFKFKLLRYRKVIHIFLFFKVDNPYLSTFSVDKGGKLFFLHTLQLFINV